jgi:hypothetical protein
MISQWQWRIIRVLSVTQERLGVEEVTLETPINLTDGSGLCLFGRFSGEARAHYNWRLFPRCITPFSDPSRLLFLENLINPCRDVLYNLLGTRTVTHIISSLPWNWDIIRDLRAELRLARSLEGPQSAYSSAATAVFNLGRILADY